MKINDKDIVRAAQELRDEENEKLHIRPWKKHRHFQLPKWLVAVPAAAFIGFVFGIWTQASKQGDTSLAALVDTVFIEVPIPQEPQQPQPNAVAEVTPNVSNHAPKQGRTSSVSPKASHRRGLVGAIGRPACDDNIRYDLLVCD